MDHKDINDPLQQILYVMAGFCQMCRKAYPKLDCSRCRKLRYYRKLVAWITNHRDSEHEKHGNS